ncbi:MAG: hypothetical protein DRJ05_19755 [Bacteroidetes bacterium]|nr:MAG: hypothetical protein DRJ05_19755 [Bacteroidota bacterium]
MEIVISDSNIKLSTVEFIKIFNLFSIEDKKQITQSIYSDTLKGEWDILDSELPNIEMSEEEIISEIQQVRYK